MSKALKIKTLFLIVVAVITYSSLNLMPSANAQSIQTSLVLAVSSPPQEKECTIEAILEDENGIPLKNMDIDFYVCGTSCIGANKTDSDGAALLRLSDDLPLFTYPKLELFETKKSETWKINAVFEGTSNYVQSSSLDVYIAFAFIDYTLYLIGGGIIVVVIICVAGYLVLQRRKRPITMPKTVKEA